MSGCSGDGEGTVWLAHAWVDDEDRQHTVGPWHWWNVYTSKTVAKMQAVRVVADRRWGEYGKHEVLMAFGSSLL